MGGSYLAMVMMVEEGRNKKQHLLSVLSHVSRWKRNIAEAQQISSESLHSRDSPSSLMEAFPHYVL